VFVSIKHIQKEKKLHADTGKRTNIVCFRRVLPSRVNALGYHWVRQKKPPFRNIQLCKQS